MKTSRFATISLLVALKVGNRDDIKNIMKRIERNWKDIDGEDLRIIGFKILDETPEIFGENRAVICNKIGSSGSDDLA
jgi:hypothetical protein